MQEQVNQAAQLVDAEAMKAEEDQMIKKQKEASEIDEGNQAHLDSQAALDDVKILQVGESKEKSHEPLQPQEDSTKILI